MVEIGGICPDRFAKVKDAFATNFAEAKERGARFSAVINGETVLDIWAGTADREGTKPFDDHSLTPIFSTGKAVMALMVARVSSTRASSTTIPPSRTTGRNSVRTASRASPWAS